MGGKGLYVNHELLGEKMTDIAKSITLLDKFAPVEEKDFLADELLVSAVKYQLLLAIEAAQNICNHLAARVAKEAPESYADCFRILGKNRIISKELAASLASMARFRNLLVHQYSKVDDGVVYRILKNNTRDLIRYIDEIKIFLRSGLEEAKSNGKEKTPADGRGKKKD